MPRIWSTMMRLIFSMLFTVIATQAADAHSCYSRKYSDQHLTAHPHQTVTSMELAYNNSKREYQIWLTRRGGETLFYNAGRCDPGTIANRPGLYCHALMDCSGDCGSFGVVFQGKESVLAHFRVGMNLFHLQSDSGPSSLKPDLDDGTFRLERAPETSCAFNPSYFSSIAPDEFVGPLPMSDGFRSPSSDVYCRPLADETGKSVLKCEIANINQPPKKPIWCKEDWGRAFEVNHDDKEGRLSCNGEQLYDELLQVLSHGSEWQADGYRCRSERVGVSCQNKGGHGFFISRNEQKLF